jgi:hypothetical protein
VQGEQTEEGGNDTYVQRPLLLTPQSVAATAHLLNAQGSLDLFVTLAYGCVGQDDRGNLEKWRDKTLLTSLIYLDHGKFGFFTFRRGLFTFHRKNILIPLELEFRWQFHRGTYPAGVTLASL